VSPPSIFSPLQVVVERYQKEKTLPPLTRTKFLVSQDLPLSQFAVTLRWVVKDAAVARQGVSTAPNQCKNPVYLQLVLW